MKVYRGGKVEVFPFVFRIKAINVAEELEDKLRFEA
jgi:hypothetical protein